MDKRIGYHNDGLGIDIIVPIEMEAEFKTLVRRAMSTWQDVSPEMRDFADRVAGVDKYVGQNMKAGHSEQVIPPAPSFRCGTCGEMSHMHPYRNCDIAVF